MPFATILSGNSLQSLRRRTCKSPSVRIFLFTGAVLPLTFVVELLYISYVTETLERTPAVLHRL